MFISTPYRHPDTKFVYKAIRPNYIVLPEKMITPYITRGLFVSRIGPHVRFICSDYSSRKQGVQKRIRTKETKKKKKCHN